MQGRNNSQAIVTFRELLNKYPESPVSRKAAAEIGLLYYQNDDYNRAIEAYKYVITQYPGSEEARLAMRDLKSIMWKPTAWMSLLRLPPKCRVLSALNPMSRIR